MPASYDAYGRPLQSTAATVQLASSPDARVPVSVSPVERPTGLPLLSYYPVSVKNSIGYKIEDVEGQSARGRQVVNFRVVQERSRSEE